MNIWNISRCILALEHTSDGFVNFDEGAVDRCLIHIDRSLEHLYVLLAVKHNFRLLFSQRSKMTAREKMVMTRRTSRDV